MFYIFYPNKKVIANESDWDPSVLLRVSNNS